MGALIRKEGGHMYPVYSRRGAVRNKKAVRSDVRKKEAVRK
jgi:hypothetical protein